jgi:hypothetical protein
MGVVSLGRRDDDDRDSGARFDKKEGWVMPTADIQKKLDELHENLRRLIVQVETNRKNGVMCADLTDKFHTRSMDRIDQLESIFKEGIKRLKDRWEERLDRIEGGTQQAEAEITQPTVIATISREMDDVNGRLAILEGKVKGLCSEDAVRHDLGLLRKIFVKGDQKLDARIDRLGEAVEFYKNDLEDLLDLWSPQKVPEANMRVRMIHYIQSLIDRYEHEDNALTYEALIHQDLIYYKGNDND